MRLYAAIDQEVRFAVVAARLNRKKWDFVFLDGIAKHTFGRTRTVRSAER